MPTCYKHPDRAGGVVCQRCDRHICPQCMHQASVGFHCPECTKAGKQKVYQGIGALRSQPIVTQVLIGVNVAIFLLGVVLDGGAAVGGDIGRLQVDFGLLAKGWQQGGDVTRIFRVDVPGTHGIGVGNGQVYRVVTSGFLHYGIIHLALNMYALWLLGQAVEHAAGRLRFGMVYAAALAAGAAGALVLSPDAFTAGASGAIYGLMGAIFVAQRSQGIPFRDSPLLPVLFLNLVFTFGVSGISIGGHLGGLVGGAAAGWLFFEVGRRPGMDKRLPVALCGALIAGCVAASYLIAAAWSYSG